MPAVFQFSDYVLDSTRFELRRGDRTLKLEKIPMELLILLLERQGELVSRDDIAERLWGKEVFLEADRGINTAISKIRVVLRDDPERPRYIQTVVGKGYRFVAPISRPETESPVPQQQVEQAMASATVNAPAPLRSERPQSRRLALASASIALAVLVLAAGYYSLRSRAVQSPQGSSQPMKSIAVLPFANATGDGDLLYLSDGIAESIINNLSQVPGLKVMSRNSAFRYRQSDLKPSKVANELGVQALLVGAVRPHGDDVRISVELIDGKDEHQIWGEEYTRKVSDMSGVQADITQQVSRYLRLYATAPASNRLTRRETNNVEAYRFYLRGKSALEPHRNNDTQTALRYFEQAAQLDRNYALAYSGMAISYSRLAFYGGMPPHEAFPLEAVALHQALDLDPDLADAHVQRGLYLEFPKMQPEAAEAEFRRALELNPNSEDAHLGYAFFLMDQGRFTEAIAEAGEVVQLDPLSVVSYGALANVYHYAGRDDDALTAAERSPQPAPPMWVVGVTYEAQKDFPRAIEKLQEVAQVYQLPLAEADLAHAYAASGNPAQAKIILRRLLKTRLKSYVSPYKLATAYAGLGDEANVFRWLRAACDESDPWLARLNIDPVFQQYRSRPQMIEIQQLMLDHAKHLPE
jgi:TolB-like protein/DNA-binding winged helix-turn-helix (wHTH) protein